MERDLSSAQREFDELAKKYAGALNVYIVVHSNGVELSHLHARKSAKPGTGSAFMADFCFICDTYGLTATLRTAPKGHNYDSAAKHSLFKSTSSESRLKQFYGRFGFVSNYGKRSYRVDLPGNMHRHPKKLSEALIERLMR